jgi:putative heme iron utilization protein
MTARATAPIKQLLHERSVAALGTLHAGAPYVSMVPYAIANDGSGLIIHVSRLSSHTRDLLADPRVSLMIMQAEGGGTSALALARVSTQGTAYEVPSDSPELPALRAVYLERFPEASQMFGFADFSLFKIQPDTIRVVAGFAQAYTMSAESFAQMLVSG